MTDIASLEVAARPARAKLKFDPLWLAAPAIAFLAVFLIWPTAQVLSLSVIDKDGCAERGGILADLERGRISRCYRPPSLLRCGRRCCACCSAIPWRIGCRASRRVNNVSRRWSCCLPFWTSALIKNFSWLVLLGRNGIVAKTMLAFGLAGGDKTPVQPWRPSFSR